jgi:transposase-like protein
MRSTKRLNEIRALPCIRCGYPHSQAAHSNSGKHGKGKGIKASDAFTVPLCHKCHFLFDTYQLGTRQESEALFDGWLEKTGRMLNLNSGEDDVF